MDDFRWRRGSRAHALIALLGWPLAVTLASTTPVSSLLSHRLASLQINPDKSVVAVAYGGYEYYSDGTLCAFLFLSPRGSLHHLYTLPLAGLGFLDPIASFQVRDLWELAGHPDPRAHRDVGLWKIRR